MFASGMKVQIRRSGTTVPIERLMIGDLVYDPLGDNYREVVDILSRPASLTGQRLVRTPARSLTAKSPCHDIISTPSQPIMCLRHPHGKGIASLDLTTADQLGCAYTEDTTLHAVFLESAGYGVVNDAVIRFVSTVDTFIEEPLALQSAFKRKYLRS